MVLSGYDNAFTSPLVSLPLFVAKYQGPGYTGTYAFTVRSPSNHLGRQKIMLVAYAFCTVLGSFLQLFAPNMAAMIVGRLWNSK